MKGGVFFEAFDEFVESTQSQTERLILLYLWLYAMGSANAKPWAWIAEWLAGKGHRMTKQCFQQGLLKRSREGRLFIGSTDTGPRPGYFLIASADDVAVAAEFYHRRIDRQCESLRWLEKLGKEYGYEGD